MNKDQYFFEILKPFDCQLDWKINQQVFSKIYF